MTQIEDKTKNPEDTTTLFSDNFVAYNAVQKQTILLMNN